MASTPGSGSNGTGSPSSRAAGPRRVLPARHAWALHDTAASRTIEARALAAEPGGALMRRAAASVARWVAAVAPHAQHIWVACGPGGNGGDGLHAAALLARRGHRVSVSLHADAGVPVSDRAPPGFSPDVAIDALLGLGSRRPPDGAVLDGVRALRHVGAPVLAVDLPTGLHADTGVALGEPVVRAHWTLSLLTLKPGLFTGLGRELSGEVWFDDLGIVATASEPPVASLYAPAAQAGPAGVAHGSHKGSFGDTVVVGGALGMAGALSLAAQAALAAGSGRTIAVPLDADAPLRNDGRPELLWRAASALAEAGWWADATVVCGCGGGEAVGAPLPRLLAQAARLVLDADALNALARDERLREGLRMRARHGLASILTPHPLEAARLLGVATREVQADRLRAAARLAGELQATIVLKGSGTVVCTPGLATGINSTGGPALASGGTGDVLAGWLGGRWSRRRGEVPAAHESAHAVAQQTVWLHGAAAEPGTVRGDTVRAQGLIDRMRHLSAQPLP